VTYSRAGHRGPVTYPPHHSRRRGRGVGGGLFKPDTCTPSGYPCIGVGGPREREREREERDRENLLGTMRNGLRESGRGSELHVPERGTGIFIEY
jgi:hypothetical protein